MQISQSLSPSKQPRTVRELLNNGDGDVNKMLKLLKLDRKQVEYVEKLTVDQSESDEWSEYRFGRITASVVGAVIKAINRDSFPKSLFDKLHGGGGGRDRDYLRYVPAVKWGRDHEREAIRAFHGRNQNLVIQNRGLILHANGIIGASPDAIVVENVTGADHRDVAVVEIKCPYKYRDCTDLYVACAGDGYFCIDGATKKLKPNHDYWHQIQCQMWVTECKRGYFLVWTPRAPLHVECIEYEPEWAKLNIPKIEKFYAEKYLPHLIMKSDTDR
jgi:YqaJ-like viral recombinase domain